MIYASIEDVIDRLKIVFSKKTDAELAEALSVAKTTLSSWKQRDSVPYAECVFVARTKKVSLDWLLLGRGSYSPSRSSDCMDESEQGEPQKIVSFQEKSNNYQQSERAISSSDSIGESEQPIGTGKSRTQLSGINTETLQLAIETVEEGLAKTNRVMLPNKKAELILSVYDLFIQMDMDDEQKQQEQTRNVIRLIKSVS